MQYNRDWLKLDNAAKIYPATSSEKSPAQFRISVNLNSPVKFKTLKQAWGKILKRCPYFQVFLRRGFFWYYLQRYEEIPPIELMDPIPNKTFELSNKKTYLIRISVRKNSIALDFSHIITDGNGAFRFMQALVFEYLRLLGIPIPKIIGIPHPDEIPSSDEFEDGHRKFFPGALPEPEILSPAFHLSGQMIIHKRFRLISGKLDLDKILDLSRRNQVSTTEYLTAVYIYSLMKIQQQELQKVKSKNSVIRLEVPVNMRKFHPSQTMRNFSLYVSPEIDLKLGNFTFKEILKKVHHSMQMQIDSKELGRQVSRNVGGELNPFVRAVPLFLKDVYLAGLHRKLGERSYSGVLSNLGSIGVPEEAKPHIESFDCILVPNHAIKKSCVVLSFGNELTINFSSVIEERELERLFFTKLIADGIPVLVKEI
jgi:Alcohol acetyltransferase